MRVDYADERKFPTRVAAYRFARRQIRSWLAKRFVWNNLALVDETLYRRALAELESNDPPAAAGIDRPIEQCLRELDGWIAAAQRKRGDLVFFTY